MSLNITSTLKNITEKVTTKEKAEAKKEKNKIIYKTQEYNCILKIVSPKKIVLNRKNDNMNCTMYFELNKTTISSYTIENEYELEINIRTTLLNITENLIKIHYTIKEAETEYEYQIEMSENK